MKIKGKSLDPKRTEADKKRIESMVQMKKEYKQQKNLIKDALSNVDVIHKNKIIFNDDNDEVMIDTNGHNVENGVVKKTALFGDDDEENDNIEDGSYNFEVKEQFQGKKGQKLLELQARFKKDERFNMDERFLEEEGDADNNDIQDNDDGDKVDNDNVDEEHKKQMQILQQVLGKPAPTSADNVKESQKGKSMLRFDPTQPEHSKFEIKEDGIVKKKKKKKNDAQANNQNDTMPNVSKETFYNVNDGLKDIFQEKQEFSILSLFNKHINKSVPENDEKSTTEEKITKKSHKSDSNPFKYDSSTDDDSEDEKELSKNNENIVTTTEIKKAELTPSRLWTESFFFKPDDYRLQEGLDFVKKMELEELSEFSKLRKDLKQIVRTKVKKTQRKNTPFKKKLGGRKKMLKIKKAMKR